MTVRRPKPNWPIYIKAMAKIQGKDILPEVKLRKSRAKETKPRKEYDRAEDNLRPLVIDALRRMGCKVMRVENSIAGKNNTGISDLLVFYVPKRFFAFVELKTEKTDLTGKQPEFREHCDKCGIRYIVIRSIEEAKAMIL